MLNDQAMEGSGLTARGYKNPLDTQAVSHSEGKKSESKQTNRFNLVCNCCKKKGHVRDECYKLDGRPQDSDRGYGRQTKGQANLSQSKEDVRMIGRENLRD